MYHVNFPALGYIKKQSSPSSQIVIQAEVQHEFPFYRIDHYILIDQSMNLCPTVDTDLSLQMATPITCLPYEGGATVQDLADYDFNLFQMPYFRDNPVFGLFKNECFCDRIGHQILSHFPGITFDSVEGENPELFLRTGQHLKSYSSALREKIIASLNARWDELK